MNEPDSTERTHKGSMKWSWKVGRLAGIDVYVHATFVLLMSWVVFGGWFGGADLEKTLAGAGFMLLLFGCIVLHELGHALAARKFGIQTRDITLLPIGGVARLERMPEDPRQELWVAVAGPAVNLVIAFVLFLWLRFIGLTPSEASLDSGSLPARLLAANVSLVLFNLLPAFPMDGGRVLRALLALRMEYTRATQIAATIGQGMALLFGFIGLFMNPFLLFIALFVWIGASQEAGTVEMKSALGGIPVGRAMVTDFHALDAGDPLSRAVDLVLTGSQVDFPVLRNGQLAGVLTRSALLIALGQRDTQERVGEIMERDFHVVDANEMLETALRRLQDFRCHTIPVLQRGRLAGLVTMDNLGEFLAIQAALKSRNGRAPFSKMTHGLEGQAS
jgi:Zn-dependent protease/CBS domain-containing protein